MGVKSATEAVVTFQGPDGRTGQVSLHWEEKDEDSVGEMTDVEVFHAFRLAIQGRKDLEGQTPVKVVIQEQSEKSSVGKSLRPKDPQFGKALTAYLMSDRIMDWMTGAAFDTFAPAISGGLAVASALVGGAKKVDRSEKEAPLDQTKLLSELERGLEMILTDSAHLENPEFSEDDFYHGHMIRKGEGYYGFLFHTRELLPPPSIASKRNIVYWFGASGYTTNTPEEGNTVYPKDLEAKEVASIYFHPDKQKALELAYGKGTPISVEVSDGQNNTITLWIVIWDS